ncbi:MAG: putative bifunctional diguanylate cyclase/phosphodiesterase [Longimicrobiales bacterium]
MRLNNLSLIPRIDASLQVRLDSAVLATIRPVAVGLAALHVVFAFERNATVPEQIRGAAVASAIATASALVLIAIVLGRWRPASRWGNSLGAIVAGAVLINAIATLSITGDPTRTANLSLFVIGVGMMFLSTEWLAIMIGTTFAAWLGIAIAAPPSPLWLTFLFHMVGATIIGAGAHVVRLRTLIRSERLRREADARARALGASEERYALSVAGANDGVYDWDLMTNRLYYSPRFKGILGYADGELDNNDRLIVDRVHPDDNARVRANLIDHLKGLTPHFEDEYRVLHRDGAYRWVLTRGVTVRDSSGRAIRMAGSMTDMTRRGVFDPLTGLPNRMLLLDRLRRVFARNVRYGGAYGLLFVDLDRFKLINDSLGHQAGDELLVQVARRLQAAVRTNDTVARLGGDEFVVVLEDVESPHDLEHTIDRIEETVLGAYAIAERDVFVSASIGAVIDTGGVYESAEDILRDADTAMYQAKQSQRRFVVFDVEMREALNQRMQIEHELRRALAREEFMLLYQPIISLERGNLEAVEALVRWEHPERGRIAPATFIRVMEEIGMIVPLGSWVLRQACSQMVSINANRPGSPPLAVTVNISSKQLARDDFPQEVATVLSETGFDPRRLMLEITESAIIENADQASAALQRLKAIGVRILMDDFGTGHSSLGSLHSLPIDSLKIDRSFISRLPADQQALELVRTMIGLGHNLGLKAVAEGIETREQLDIVTSLDCDLAQGMLLGVPDALEFASNPDNVGLSRLAGTAATTLS